MADFPTLKPAFTMQVLIDPAVNVGSTAKNCNFVVTPMVGGTVKSEPGFSPAFNGQLASNGNDYIRTDPDGKRLRLDAHTVVKTETGASVYINYTGVVDLTPEITAILTGHEGAASTPFGNIFITLKFESGDAEHAALENGIFVASGRFIYEKGQRPIVDYKVSQVCKG
ncbi:hypothetical protein MGYG_04543 [Nannizzia gypsea CBS 118893]|uniref:Uncharacterized protein n=1 Tax=Arthroderma gypseum (strain ATCC MYA-4604 / CBS 118893) TaxID=535722 RepID=E4UTP8_ARTGP|nr:hypothetical protein MGYG_04543 [Nannizzia gypsea CBS 118893]EFR01541.1 hypothetical protein MGYG_04543 [Nannizzia gypsea CBS 118893]